MGKQAGICPSCAGQGHAGEPCSERTCTIRGYRFIPEVYAQKLQKSGWGRFDAVIGQLIGDYVPVDILGQGGFGKVYLALQLPILMKAALKLMEGSHSDSRLAETMLKKFESEAQALATLNHPNLVRLLKYGAHQGVPYLVMEFVAAARTLRDEIQDLAGHGQRMELGVVHHILRQIVDGLDAAHQLAIVHRDIKPENIMIQRVAGNDHLVRILDFGLAKFVAERADTSIAMGTPTYMAPEQLTRKNIGPWTDLYAVGIIAFQLLTGRIPFPSRTHQEMFAKKLDPAYDPTAGLADLEAPPQVLAFLRRALARSPEERYASAASFREGLAQVFDRLQDEAAAFRGPLESPEALFGDGDPDSEPPPATAILPAAIQTGRATSGSLDGAITVHVERSASRSIAPRPATARRARSMWKWLAVGLAAGALVVGAVLVSREGEPELPRLEEASNSPAEPVPASVPTPALPVQSAPERPAMATPADAASAPPEPLPVVVAPAVEVVAPVVVTIETDPPGALCSLDGRQLGPTPQVVSWPVGAAPPVVRLQLRGYRVETVKLALADAGTTRRIKLGRLPVVKQGPGGSEPGFVQ